MQSRRACRTARRPTSPRPRPPIRSALPDLARSAAALARLGITTPREALWYLPFRYDDFSELRPLGDLLPDEKQSARVRVEAIRIEPGFGRRPQRVIAQLSDDKWQRGGDLVRAPLRRAPAAAGRRDHRVAAR